MKRSILSAILVAACATTIHAQTDAIYVDKDGNVGIGISGNIPTRLCVKGQLSLDEKVYSIGTFTNGPGKSNEMRFTTSMTYGLNSGGGFNFCDFRNRSAMRIVDFKVGIGVDSPRAALEVKGRIRDSIGYVTPVGGIIMWSGNKDVFDGTGKGKPGTAVEGWAICNGQNSTPDLQDRFIVAAGRNYPVNEKRGADNVTLSVAQMPSHTHSLLTRKSTDSQPGWTNYSINAVVMTDHEAEFRDRAIQLKPGCTWPQATNNPLVNFTGGNQAFDNRPAYCALLYIMKL